jgi:hypothetical protein
VRARGGAGDGCVLQGRSGADENESFKEIDRAIERKLKEDQGVDAPKPAKALWLPESTTSSMRVMPKDFLPKREEDWKKWYHYQGSLTTEPYSENVSWFVLPVVADVRSSDVRYLATQTFHEPRKVHALDRRFVLRSFAELTNSVQLDRESEPGRVDRQTEQPRCAKAHRGCCRGRA